MVDSEENVARATAKKLGIPCMKASEFVRQVLNGHEVFQCMLHDDVTNPDVWVAIRLANAGFMLGSPPCQPWSTAGSAHGLQSQDDKVFLCTLRLVPGLPRHQDFRELISLIEKDGLKLLLHGVFACAKVLPVHRDRWLGTFVQADIHVEPAKRVIANAISFADRAFEAVASCPTIRDADVLHVNMSSAELQQLLFGKELSDMLSNWIPNPTADHVLHARVVTDCRQYIGFMAMYGNQHNIPEELLRTKGLQTIYPCQQCSWYPIHFTMGNDCQHGVFQ